MKNFKIMLGNISTIDEVNSENKTNHNEKIMSKIYKNPIDNPIIIKTDDNYTNDKEIIHDSSGIYLKQTKIENKFFNPILENSKRRISKTTYGIKKFCKKIKKVTIDEPFTSIVPIESYKEYNLKMTYNEFPNINPEQQNKSCPCNKKICSIY